jgi:hypothetical protein
MKNNLFIATLVALAIAACYCMGELVMAMLRIGQ